MPMAKTQNVIFWLMGRLTREGRAERKSEMSQFCDACLACRRICQTLMVDQKIFIFLSKDGQRRSSKNWGARVSQGAAGNTYDFGP